MAALDEAEPEFGDLTDEVRAIHRKKSFLSRLFGSKRKARRPTERPAHVPEPEPGFEDLSTTAHALAAESPRRRGGGPRPADFVPEVEPEFASFGAEAESVARSDKRLMKAASRRSRRPPPAARRPEALEMEEEEAGYECAAAEHTRIRSPR